jgi:hypothetical protein
MPNTNINSELIATYSVNISLLEETRVPTFGRTLTLKALYWHMNLIVVRAQQLDSVAQSAAQGRRFDSCQRPYSSSFTAARS